MAERKWNGGATTIAQVMHATPGGTIETDDIFIVKLTDEGGSEVSVPTTAGSATLSDVTAAIRSACAASSNALFQAITWTEDGTKVIATAKQPGVPFHMTLETTEAGGGAADAQTFVLATSQANSGPNDFDTAANWSGTTVPVTGDDVIFADSHHSLLYSLRQTSISLESLRFSLTFTGAIGQTDTYHPLAINTNNSAGSVVLINTGGRAVYLEGTSTLIYVERLGGDVDALRLGGAMTDIHLQGQACAGGVRILDSASFTNLYQLGANNCNTVIGESVTGFTLIEGNAGTLEVNSAMSTGQINWTGGVCEFNEGSLRGVKVTGGVFYWNSSGDLGDNSNNDYGPKVLGGIFSTRKSHATSTAIYNCDVHGTGQIQDTGGTANVTWDRDVADVSAGVVGILRHGGTVHSDSASQTNPKAA